MSRKSSFKRAQPSAITAIILTASISLPVAAEITTTIIGNDQNAVFGVTDNIKQFLSGNRGSNGGGDQSMQAGDALGGTDQGDLLVGALGVDVLLGYDGDDILIGGTEDFNPLNRDRAFGGTGDDVFVWAPGDGNDFFDGGGNNDVVMFGLIGEQRNAENSEEGAPFFAVSPPSANGSQDFDGVYIDPSSNLPIVDVAGSPGFCEVVDGYLNSTEQAELDALGLDHLIRFTLRGPAADTANPDTGLRIAVHLTNTEYMVCGGETAGEIVALDLTTSPPTPIDLSELPAQAFNLIQ